MQIINNNAINFIILSFGSSDKHSDVFAKIKEYIPTGYTIGCFGNYGTSDSDNNNGITLIDTRTAENIKLKNVNETVKLTIYSQNYSAIGHDLNLGFIPIL